MDRNFHTDEFERLLREKSDEFRMYPSKRIWNSIYNNIHPGRKWPSVAMSITLISALLILGYLNTKNTNFYLSEVKNPIQENVNVNANSTKFASQNLVPYSIGSDITPSSVTNARSNNPDAAYKKISIADINNFAGTALSPFPANTNQLKLNTAFISGEKSVTKIDAITGNLTKNELTAPALEAINNLPGSTSSSADNQTENKVDNNALAVNDPSGFLTYAQKTPILNFLQEIQVINHPGGKASLNVVIMAANSTLEKNSAGIKDNATPEERSWIENYALYNRPAVKKWAKKLAWQLYVTPSVVYRKLFNDPNFGNTLNNAPFALYANQDINNAVNQKPSMGFEVGSSFQYPIFKIFKIKAGLQLNYTRYNSDAFQNTHPVATRITMHDYTTNTTYEEYQTTPYSNKNGLEAVKLHNETFQISMPIGAEMKLMGNDNLQWNIGATIQPTYVAGGKSYLISSDRRYYVKETSMLNRFNLDAGFETFISYKTNGVTFSLGPQFRTQLFSTNNKSYVVEERLLNYGLKFGISKTLK